MAILYSGTSGEPSSLSGCPILPGDPLPSLLNTRRLVYCTLHASPLFSPIYGQFIPDYGMAKRLTLILRSDDVTAKGSLEVMERGMVHDSRPDGAPLSNVAWNTPYPCNIGWQNSSKILFIRSDSTNSKHGVFRVDTDRHRGH